MRLLRSLLPLLAPVLLLAGFAGQALAAGYDVGPGDVLSVTIRGGSEGDQSDQLLTVAGDGSIDVTYAGRFKVNGLTTPAIQSAIKRRLKDKQIFASPQVTVNITEYGSQPVNVAGAVGNPMRVYLKGPTRLTDVLAEAGGISSEMAGTEIHVKRRGVDVPIVVKRSALYGGDPAAIAEANISMLAFDDVYVTTKGRACVNGPVTKPDCYELEEGTTLLTLLALAGGFDEITANRTKITIWRTYGGDSKLVVDMDQIEAGEVRPPRIMPGDNIVVARKVQADFCISGPVLTPDCYEFTRGLTLNEAISKAGSFDVTLADRTNIIVNRDGVELPKNLERSGDGNFPIERGDQIIVGEIHLKISVGGAVKDPGVIDFYRGMTIVDAIAAAGGTEGNEVFGNLKNVVLRRGDNAREVNVKKIQQGKASDIELEAGDKINVQPKRFGW